MTLTRLICLLIYPARHCTHAQSFFVLQVMKSVHDSCPGRFEDEVIKRLHCEILIENRARRKENEKKEAEKFVDRSGYLYSNVSLSCKLAKLGSAFQERRAYGGHSSTFFGLLLADVFEIPLGKCDYATARRRLLRAEHLVRFQFQNFLVVKGMEVC
jgi:hypothetical protein